jgi:hypothetical protein
MSCLTQEQLDTILNAVSTIKSRRMKILEATKMLLNYITIENGYSHNVFEASFDVNAWRDKTEGTTPAIFIVDDSSNEVRNAGKTRFVTWNTILFGVVKNYTIQEFEEHIADVQECLEHNASLGGLVSKIEVNNIVTDTQLFSEKENTHLYEMRIQFEYVRCFGDAK